MPDTHAPAKSQAQLRVDLAACLRLAAYFGYNEGIGNHFSYAIDADGGRFLVNPNRSYWTQVTASDLLLVDRHGTVLEGEGPVDATAFHIHSRVHLAHPKARCVLHTHMPHATALALLEDMTLEMISQNALMFYDRVAYDTDYNGLVFSNQEGDRIADALGDGKTVMMMANHGVLVTAPTIAQAWERLYTLERAAQVQILAMSTGLPRRPVDPETGRRTAEELDCPEMSETLFTAMKQVLDRDLPGYAD